MKDKLINDITTKAVSFIAGVKLTTIQARDAVDYLTREGVRYVYLYQPDGTVYALLNNFLPWVKGDTFNYPEEAVQKVNKYWPADDNVKLAY